VVLAVTVGSEGSRSDALKGAASKVEISLLSNYPKRHREILTSVGASPLMLERRNYRGYDALLCAQVASGYGKRQTSEIDMQSKSLGNLVGISLAFRPNRINKTEVNLLDIGHCRPELHSIKLKS
jgi:hypothetical protein